MRVTCGGHHPTSGGNRMALRRKHKREAPRPELRIFGHDSHMKVRSVTTGAPIKRRSRRAPSSRLLIAAVSRACRRDRAARGCV